MRTGVAFRPMRADSSARRLHDLLDTMATVGEERPRQTVASILSAAFNPTDSFPAVVGQVGDLIDDVRVFMDGSDAGLLKHSVAPVRAIERLMTPDGLTAQYGAEAGGIVKAALPVLGFLAQFMEAAIESVAVPSDIVETAFLEISRLLEELSEMESDAEDVAFVRRVLLMCLEALNEYKRFGPDALERTVERIIGHITVHSDQVEHLKSSPGLLATFSTAVATLVATVTLAKTGVDVWHAVGPAVSDLPVALLSSIQSHGLGGAIPFGEIGPAGADEPASD